MIDASVRLYGFVFPLVAQKHRVQMLEHFSECIKQAKSSRQQAVQINIFTAVLCALKVNKIFVFLAVFSRVQVPIVLTSSFIKCGYAIFTVIFVINEYTI